MQDLSSLPEPSSPPLAPASESGSAPSSSSLPSLPSSSSLPAPVEPPTSSPETSPAIDLSDAQVCDLAFVWQELTSQPVSCSGEGLISFSAPSMPRSTMAERVESALRSVSNVRKTKDGMDIVVTDDARSSPRSYASERDDARLINLDASEAAVRGAVAALSIDATVTTSEDGGVQVLATEADGAYLLELFGSGDLVDASVYLPSMQDSSESVLALYQDSNISFDAGTSVLHVRATRDVVDSLFSRLRYYTPSEAPVRVRAWIVESRSDISRRFGLNLDGDGTNLISGLVRNASVLSPTLELLESDGMARLLSSPELTVKSGKSARVNAGDSFPIQKTTVSEGVVSTEYEYRDTGISMTISPTVRPDGSVTLDVDLEASTASGAGEAPVIAKRSVSSSLHLTSGQTVALSGLRTLSQSSSSSGLPGIPGISDTLPLGRMDAAQTQDTYLTIFLSVDVR